VLREMRDPMLDDEAITVHVTKIGGTSYPDDYTVIWRGLPIGRIRKSPGLPAHVVDQWWWGCNVYGQPSLSGDSGQGTGLEDCKGKFRIAWARIHADLTEADIARAEAGVNWLKSTGPTGDLSLGGIEPAYTRPGQ